MATRKWSLFLVLGAISTLAGCSGGTTANVQNPPAPAVSQVSIAFQPTPPSSVAFEGSTPLTAVVNNDPSSSGVDWSLNCQNVGNCGNLSPLHTTSGQATTYSPSSLSSNQGVTIFAFATADHTKNVQTSIAINGFAGFLQQGTYIVETNGVDGNGNAYQRAAAIALDGNGHVTGGEQTVNFTNPSTFVTSSVNDMVMGGSYIVGPDGRGGLVINTNDLNVGQQGVETFSLVILSSSQALLTKTDILTSPISTSNETSVGTMDLQTPGARLTTGGYALVLKGVNLSPTPVAFGGVLNVDGSQSISGSGSKFDMVIDGNTTVTPSTALSGTVSTADTFGTVQVSLTTDFGALQLTAYVIDASHFKLIETDDTVGITVGAMVGQGPLVGAFSSFSGAYTFGIFGADVSTFPYTLAAAGSFAASGGTISNGNIDELQSSTGVQVTDGFTATYTIDPSGRVDTGSSFTFATGSNGTGPELVFYLTASGNPVLVLDADTEPSLSGGGVGTGLAYLSTAGATFAGDYGLSVSQNLTGTEADGTGQICVNGSSVTCPSGLPAPPADSFSGTVDPTVSFSPLVPTPVTGTFQVSATSGRLTGTFPNLSATTTNLSVAFYLIDSTHGFFVETDGGASEANAGDLTFGYFAGRTPVCNGCP